MEIFVLIALGCLCSTAREIRQKDATEWSFLWEEPKHHLTDYLKTYNDPISTVSNMMQRVFEASNYDTSLTSQFELEIISINKPNNNHPNNVFNHSFLEYLDIIEFDTNSTSNNIILRGSSTIALAMAFNLYLQHLCNTTYDWRTYTIELPTTDDNTVILPRPSTLERLKRSVPLTYYENVCTVSYSQAFWGWQLCDTSLCVLLIFFKTSKSLAENF